MNALKAFEEFINEDSKPALLSFQDDDCPILDIGLSDMPIEELKNQYVDFETLVVMPPAFGDPLLKSSKERRLNEGVEKSFKIQTVRKSIMRKYELQDWQFKSTEAANEKKVALILPHLGSNEQLAIEDMESLGYYNCDSWFAKREGMTYTILYFKDFLEEQDNGSIVSHLPCEMAISPSRMSDKYGDVVGRVVDDLICVCLYPDNPTVPHWKERAYGLCKRFADLDIDPTNKNTPEFRFECLSKAVKEELDDDYGAILRDIQ